MQVGPPTFAVLYVLGRRGPLSQREVCDIVNAHPSDMVGLIDKLEGHGLVERSRDPKDRRRYQLSLTAKGNTVLGQFSDIASAAEDAVLAPLSAHERVQLKALTDKAVSGHDLG